MFFIVYTSVVRKNTKSRILDNLART